MEIGALYNWRPSSGPVNIAFVETEVFAGSGFPSGKRGHAFVSESGPTWATGPQALGKRISEFVFDDDGSVQGDPTPLVQYNGSGKATIAGLAAGPDGLYFTSLYKDDELDVPTASGARVYRVLYAPPASDRGLLGEYFSGADFTGERIARVDANIAFNWFALAPAPGMAKDEFSVRYTGEIQAEFSETYTFSFDTSDRVRLWLDDTLVVDGWEPPLEPPSGSISLTADRRYALRIDFAEGTEGARLILSWESPSQPSEVVPTDRLYPP
jgi:hypothetical protein